MADLGGGPGACPPTPQGSRFFHFDIQSFRNVTASGVAPPPPPTRSTSPYGKSWIRHCQWLRFWNPPIDASGTRSIGTPLTIKSQVQSMLFCGQWAGTQPYIDNLPLLAHTYFLLIVKSGDMIHALHVRTHAQLSWFYGAYLRDLRKIRTYMYNELVANPCYARNVLGGVNPPRSAEAIVFSQQKWKSTVDPLSVDCWPPQDQHRQSPFHVKVDCWSSLCQLSIPPGSTVLIASTLIVDCLSIDCQSTPTTDFDFLIFNICAQFSKLMDTPGCTFILLMRQI